MPVEQRAAIKYFTFLGGFKAWLNKAKAVISQGGNSLPLRGTLGQ